MKKPLIIIMACVLLISSFAACNSSGNALRWQERLDLGMKFLLDGNYEAAIVMLESAIDIEPKAMEAYVKLSEAYVGTGATDLALEILEQALANKPDTEWKEKIELSIEEISGSQRSGSGQNAAVVPAAEGSAANDAYTPPDNNANLVLQAYYSTDELRLPYINIDSPDAKMVNDEIRDMFDEFPKREYVITVTPVHINTDYFYNINDNILSVVIVRTRVWGLTVIYAYNIDIQTGKLLDYEAMAKYVGGSRKTAKNDFLNIISSAMQQDTVFLNAEPQSHYIERSGSMHKHFFAVISNFFNNNFTNYIGDYDKDYSEYFDISPSNSFEPAIHWFLNEDGKLCSAIYSPSYFNGSQADMFTMLYIDGRGFISAERIDNYLDKAIAASKVHVQPMPEGVKVEAVITPKQTSGEVRGNTTGNIANGGYAAYSDGWIYYITMHRAETGGYSGMLYKIRNDGSEKTALNVNDAFYINVIGDWIYYMDWQRYAIYKVRTDGSQNTQVSSHYITGFNVVDDWIYYIDSGRIFKMRTDGSEDTKLNDAEFCRNINVVGNWIYYISGDGNSNTNYIYRMRTDGSQNTQINDTGSDHINVVGDWIYYNSNYNDNGMYKMRTDGSENIKLNDDDNYYINIVGDWVYYINDDSGSMRMYKMRTDGTEQQVAN